MTEKELKKLNRYQLLEMLILQTERADELQKQLEIAQKQLQSRNVRIKELGSIAEASLHISGMMDAAQNAADIYLEAAKKNAAEIEEAAMRKAELILKAAKRKAYQILTAAEKAKSQH